MTNKVFGQTFKFFFFWISHGKVIRVQCDSQHNELVFVIQHFFFVFLIQFILFTLEKKWYSPFDRSHIYYFINHPEWMTHFRIASTHAIATHVKNKNFLKAFLCNSFFFVKRVFFYFNWCGSCLIVLFTKLGRAKKFAITAKMEAANDPYHMRS